jgi:hypothetical protein
MNIADRSVSLLCGIMFHDYKRCNFLCMPHTGNSVTYWLGAKCQSQMKKAVKMAASVIETTRSVPSSSCAASKAITNRATWAAVCRNQNLKETSRWSYATHTECSAAAVSNTAKPWHTTECSTAAVSNTAKPWHTTECSAAAVSNIVKPWHTWGCVYYVAAHWKSF